MRIPAIAAMVAQLLLHGCAMAPPPAELRLDEIELGLYVGALRTVPVTIEGEQYAFLFDTGGGFTSVDPSLAAPLGCTPHGRNTGFRMSGEAVHSRKCGRVTLHVDGVPIETDVDVFDLNALLPDDFPPLYGVISLHTFKDRVIQLDLSNDRVRIAGSGSVGSLTQDQQEVPVSLERELEGRGLNAYLRARADVGDVLLLLDSGNLTGVRMTPAALAQFDRRDPGTGSATVELDFGSGLRCTRKVEIVELIHDGALDANFLRASVVTLDLHQGRAWMRMHQRGDCGPK